MDAPFTAYHDTPNKSVRQNVARRGVVLHHAALTSLDYLRRLCMGEKQVSATGICKDHNFERLMSDGWRPWSLSSALWDSALRSVETANESTVGWTISDASHWSLARGVAYWATIDGFWPHRDGDPKTWTVLGHREVYTIHNASYATACPGGMDLDLVTRRAQQILREEGEDEMTPEQATKLAEIHWMLNSRVRPQIAELLARPEFDVDAVIAATVQAVRDALAADITVTIDEEAIARAVRRKFTAEPLV